MPRNRNPNPTPFDLIDLPRWARVAFAARCARRTQPLFTRSQVAIPEHSDTVEQAIKFAESAARKGRANDSSLARAFAVDAAKVAANVAHNAAAGFAALAANYAANAANAHDAHSAAADAGDSSIRAALAVGAAQAAISTTAMWADYDTLLAMTKERQWTDESPVDPEWLGPLWPGDRSPWTLGGSAIADVPQLTIEIETGDATPEMIADYLEALDDLFHACGGVKLSFKREGCRLFATAEVPS